MKQRHDVTHVVLVPRILYWEEWQSRFEKEMDIWSYPWLLRLESEKVFEIGRALSKLSKESHVRVGDYLCQLWSEPRALPEVQRSLLPRDFNGASLAELGDEMRFKTARPGDHICSSFQCPNCQSQNIRGRDLDPGYARDQAFEALVIRATLDVFWAHATSTVEAHVAQGKKKAIGVQYGTARKVRATLTVLWEASPESLADIVLSTGSRRRRYVGTRNPAKSRWYEHFNKGVRVRMGDIVSQDRAYTIEVLHALINHMRKIGSARAMTLL
eukprot:scaffold10186_cov44-Cyclotella_meneghiniana.AAC.5